MIETARNLEVSVDGLTVVKKEILETIFVKLNADARNLFYLSTPVNQAVGFSLAHRRLSMLIS